MPANTNIQSTGQTYSLLMEDVPRGSHHATEMSPPGDPISSALFHIHPVISDLNLISDGFLAGKEGAVEPGPLNDYVFLSLTTLPWLCGIGYFILNYVLSQA